MKEDGSSEDYNKINSSNKTDVTFPRILPRPSHNLSRRLIDPDALKIMYRISNRGFIAYLVGGCVRDILLNIRPKDFDVCTDAHPSQIKKMFRNCRLIGRRFRLAHILCRNDKIIEVSTFRREPDSKPDTLDRRSLTIHSNQYYGTPEEDARRRDFTINAIYYNIRDFSIIDYVGGIDDLNNRIIRIIGEPKERFFEDPVRMMRGIEFAVRLNFTIEPDTIMGIKECHNEIQFASPARIKEEILSIFQSGLSFKCFSYFLDTGLFPYIFSVLRPYSRHQIRTLLSLLKRMDISIEDGSFLSEHLCFSTFLWPFVHTALRSNDIKTLNEFDVLLGEVINPFSLHFHLRIHVRHMIKEILRSVWRMMKGIGTKGEFKLIRKDYFPEAMQLFRWLGECRQIDPDLVIRWGVRIKELTKYREGRGFKRRYWKRKRKKAPSG